MTLKIWYINGSHLKTAAIWEWHMSQWTIYETKGVPVWADLWKRFILFKDKLNVSAALDNFEEADKRSPLDKNCPRRNTSHLGQTHAFISVPLVLDGNDVLNVPLEDQISKTVDTTFKVKMRKNKVGKPALTTCQTGKPDAQRLPKGAIYCRRIFREALTTSIYWRKI